MVRISWRLAQPILARKPLDPRELSLITGDDRIAERDSLSSNEKIVAAGQAAPTPPARAGSLCAGHVQ
jgi:hypothetical protein